MQRHSSSPSASSRLGRESLAGVGGSEDLTVAELLVAYLLQADYSADFLDVLLYCHIPPLEFGVHLFQESMLVLS